MPGFSLTPLGTFPPPTPDDFPVGIQWQDDGTNLGDRTVDTVNLRRGLVASRGTAETANVLTVDANVFTWSDVTADYDLLEADLGNGLRVDFDGSNVAIIVPGDTELGIAQTDGDVSVLIMQAGVGVVSVVPQSGVTINVRSALLAQTAGRYAVLSLIHTGTDEWVLCGDLAAA
jgi:hypothetical protein